MDCNHDGLVYKVSTNSKKFKNALRSEVKDIDIGIDKKINPDWPILSKKKMDAQCRSTDNCRSFCLCPKTKEVQNLPSTSVILDLIQFCYQYVAVPKYKKRVYCEEFLIDFDKIKGESEFKEKINCILARNQVVYELEEKGNIKRLSPLILGEKFESIDFNTGDGELDKLLEDARKKYLSSDENIHKEAIEKLWDAWERLKSLDNPKPNKKKQSMQNILDRVALDKLDRQKRKDDLKPNNFREMLEIEANILTKIGNDYRIRHHESSKAEIKDIEHYDYLFHRLLSMVLLLVNFKLVNA